MQNQNHPEEVLRRDALGRVSISKDKREALLDEFERSGLKGGPFAKTGLWMMTKRLEQGCFYWPREAEAGQVKLKLTPEAFCLLTDGIDMHQAKPRGWYERAD